MTVSVVQVVNGALVASEAATVTSTLTNAIVAGDVVVALIATNASGTNHSMAGLGATWTRAAKDSLGLLDLWVGTGATSTGTVTATLTTSVSGSNKYLNLWHVRGTGATFVAGADNATADTLTSTAMTVGPGQIFIGSGYTADNQFNAFTTPKNPATGWVESGVLELVSGQRYASRVYRIPSASENHHFSTFRSGSTAHPIVRLVLGVRTNLVTNPSFEVGTTGYWAGTRVTTEAYTGTASLQLSAGASNTRLTGFGTTSGATANADAIPIPPGEQVIFSAYVKAASASGPSIRLKIHWFNASGGWISDTDNAAVVLGTSWTRLSVSAAAPANAAKFGVVIFDWFGGTGGTMYTDGWLVERSGTLRDYFDGSTTPPAGYTNAWTGTANASTSTQTVAPANPTVTVKHRESGAWVSRTAVPKVRVAGAWVTKRPKRWNGTAWVDLA